MINRKPLLTALAFAGICLSSCKNGKTGLFVPKDATFVLQINTPSLTSKLSWKEITASKWFQDMQSETHDSLSKKLMENPDVSGIDTKEGFAFFMKKQGYGAYTALEGTLNNSLAFEIFNKARTHGATVHQEGDLRYMYSEDHSLMSWKDSKFIYISDASAAMPAGQMSEHHDGHYFATDSLKKFTLDLFALNSSNSNENDEHFQSLMKENGDLQLWMNGNSFIQSMPGNGLASLFALNPVFQGNVATMTVSFDAGKISMKAKQYYGKEMTAVMDKYPMKPVTKDLVNRIPGQNISGVFVMNYPPEAIKEYLRLANLDGMANGFLGQYNYSLDELIQATKGQMVLALTNFSLGQPSVPTAENPYQRPNVDIQYLLAVSVNNKPSFDKLVQLAVSKVPDTTLLSKVSFKVTNDWFAFSNSQNNVDAFISGANNNVPFADKITGHPFGFYIDIQKILQGMNGATHDNSGAMAASLATWKDFIMTGGDYKDGVSTANMEINLVDQSTNSLKQLNQYAEKLYEASKNRREMYNDLSDTTAPTEAAPVK